MVAYRRSYQTGNTVRQPDENLAYAEDDQTEAKDMMRELPTSHGIWKYAPQAE